MLNDQRALTVVTSNHQETDPRGDEFPIIRDIHALSPQRGPHRREAWDTGSHRSSSLSIGSTTTEGAENFTTMSREFSALVLAGSTVGGTDHESSSNNLSRIREEENLHDEINPLAIVPDSNPLESPRAAAAAGDRLAVSTINSNPNGEVSVQRVKKEEVESKINAWQNAKVAKVNNRFKREDAVINGWEGEQVQKATSWMKKVEVLN